MTKNDWQVIAGIITSLFGLALVSLFSYWSFGILHLGIEDQAYNRCLTHFAIDSDEGYNYHITCHNKNYEQHTD